jgi:hypothetical protein
MLKSLAIKSLEKHKQHSVGINQNKHPWTWFTIAVSNSYICFLEKCTAAIYQSNVELLTSRFYIYSEPSPILDLIHLIIHLLINDVVFVFKNLQN